MLTEKEISTAITTMQEKIRNLDKDVSEDKKDIIEIRERTIRCEQSLKSEHLRLNTIEEDLKQVKDMISAQSVKLEKMDTILDSVTAIKMIVKWIGAIGAIFAVISAGMKIFG